MKRFLLLQDRKQRHMVITLMLALMMALGWRGEKALAAGVDEAQAPAGSGVRSVVNGDDDDGDDDNGGSDDDDDDGGDDNGGSDDDDDSGDDNGGSDDDDDDDDDDNEIERRGRLQARPDGTLFGQWVVNGVTYTATEQTEFETEYGGFVVGVCVEVKSPIADPTFAKEIETEQDYKCSGVSDDDDDRAEGELYGTVSQLPDGAGPGLWIIGGKEFTATEQTEFDREGGTFAVGVLVKVEFYTDSQNRSFAKEIELKYNDDDDDDDREYGGRPDDDGHTYGTITGRPDGSVLGIWTIGGIDYLVDERTIFDDDNDDYSVGSWVKVLYVVESDSSRRAVKIDDSDDDGGAQTPDDFKLVGTVDAMPAQGFVGTWTVAGAEFVADANTRFEEDDGLFAVGAYVKVEYVIADNVRRILEIETDVPPGAGDDDTYGAIQGIGSLQAAATLPQQSGVWTIDGVQVVVTDGTQLDDTRGALTVGSTALVNSYTNSNGERVATRIRAVQLDQQIFLPQSAR